MNKKIKINSLSKKYFADLHTPVELYLKLRDKFNGGLLLESSDYHTKNNSYSFLCFNPVAEFKIEKNTLCTKYDENISTVTLINKLETIEHFQNFLDNILVEGDEFALNFTGLFGYTAYDAIPYFENIKFKKNESKTEIPVMQYALYQIVVIFNHFNDELFIILNNTGNKKTEFEEIERILENNDSPSFKFNSIQSEQSTTSDNEYKTLITKAKQHCKRGDVFQLVLSKKFSQKFAGDEFNVYRALRSINPSPYLFYFDYVNFKIFGSSPEAQLIINNGKAQIHPIAGTYKRTGNDDLDREAAIKLSKDIKENSEHVMLVDLARNDLSRNSKKVHVETFKEIQYFSHVIHLVSKVEGELNNKKNGLRVFADTFPAGTLSGAPKYKAMQLIDKYEKESRGFYGGAIGFLKFNGDINHAILIRSFLSMNNNLYYQAGAGIVIDSDEEKELQEVKNKSEALRKAISIANKL